MADVKISALTGASTPLAGTEVLPIVQSSATVKVSVANLTAGRAVSVLSLTSTNDSTVNGLTVGKGLASAATNTAVGVSTLAAITTGTGNTMVGYLAGTLITDGTTNTAVGSSALAANISGIQNTAIGQEALSGATANFNTAVGRRAGSSVTSGVSNTAVGRQALLLVTTTSDSTALGAAALTAATGERNTAVGSLSGGAITTGTQNTIVGTFAGKTGTNDLTTGSNNTIIGYNSSASAAAAANEITLGNASIATLRCQVTSITALSDARDKADIENLPLGLDFISALQPRRFKWDRRDWYKEVIRDEDGSVEVKQSPEDGSKKSKDWTAGLIAQEVDSVAQSFGADWLNLVYKSNPEKLELTSGNLLPILIQAIKDLNEKVKLLEQR